jgi:myo-inositol-1(or 4)-monophosphatase
MADYNLQEIHDLLVKVAHQAGQMIMSAHPKSQGQGIKKNSTLCQTQ